MDGAQVTFCIQESTRELRARNAFSGDKSVGCGYGDCKRLGGDAETKCDAWGWNESREMDENGGRRRGRKSLQDVEGEVRGLFRGAGCGGE